MKALKSVAVSLAFGLAATGAVFAQYVGPSSVKRITVAEVLKSGADDQHVALRGHLLKSLGSEKYDFSDGTGTIRVEIDAKDFPQGPIDDKVTVEIQGKLEKDFMHSPEIDVNSIRRVD